MVFFLYRAAVAALFYTFLPFLLLYVLVTGRYRSGLAQRFGFYPKSRVTNPGENVIWLHAASVGEVQAAKSIVIELQKRFKTVDIVLTTMTDTGRDIAEKQLGSQVRPLLAPLDVPGITGRAIEHIRPDLYICIETELWPTLLYDLDAKGVKIAMVNGRISERSYTGYTKIQRLLSQVLCKFDRMAVITEEDRRRYVSLGAREGNISVHGNVKYDFVGLEQDIDVAKKYEGILNISGERVFIAGSTHNDEELKLLPLYEKLSAVDDFVFIIAPRHIDRCPALQLMFENEKIDYQLLSDLHSEKRREETRFILVDTMGELAELYVIADFIFCGGSLVKKGGHNLMEAAVRNRIVFHGPSVEDFSDAAAQLAEVGGAEMVNNVKELEERINFFLQHSDEWESGCKNAGQLAKKQQGSSSRQVSYILEGARNKFE